MEKFWTELLIFCQTTTQRIGNHLIAQSGKLQAIRKADDSLVTQADTWADREIREAIATTFPTHGVLTEETEHLLPKNDWCWVVDPIDGTTNFTRGIPIWGISLGLLYQGTPVFGFVYLPQLQQTFHGYWYGNSGLTGPSGAFLNSQPIHVSPDFPSKNHLFNLCARSIDILKQPFPCKVRMIGVASYNLLLVAAGASLGGVEATPKIWDIAAAWVILQAAGGVFVHLEPESVFPLEVNQDYGLRPFPCLASSSDELVSLFKPLVEFIGTKVITSNDAIFSSHLIPKLVGTTEAAFLLNISISRVKVLLQQQRIQGATKEDGIWRIPLIQGMPKVKECTRGLKGTWRKENSQ